MNVWSIKSKLPVGESGNWKVIKYKVTPDEERLQKMRCAFNPHREERFVPAGEYTALARDGVIIMSDTPDEIRDFIPAVEAASGNCLIGGLGMGLVASAMLRKPEVKKVTVIELSPDVINLVVPHLKEEFGDRLEVINDDIFTWKPEAGQTFEVGFYDIWDDINVDNLEGMGKLKRKFGKVCGWQGCWQEEGCRAQKRRIKNKTGWY